MMSEDPSKSGIGSDSKIAELNDAFRGTFSGGRVLLTAGVNELPDMVKAEALLLVATYDRFDARNDPHGERDFGSFELVGRKFIWKIDYYDARMEQGTEDASDQEKTLRVLTLVDPSGSNCKNDSAAIEKARVLAIGASLDEPAVDPTRRIAVLDANKDEIFTVPVYSKPA